MPVSQRRRFHVEGVVQGVGFRPWVHGLATRHGLAGFVLNEGRTVVIEAEGDAAALDALAAALVHPPAPARVEVVSAQAAPPTGASGFAVVASRNGEGGALPVPPDVATCDECLRELLDPSDRRYRYPFIACARCGPRFTIVRGLPYDRRRTTMEPFPLCDDCRREYDDPSDRRFHAEATACPACGPRLSLPLEDAVWVLRQGGIVAIKGLGGWHLACDARDEAAVARLRERKRREARPFAVMALHAGSLAAASATEIELLRSPSRPIVLCRRRPNAGLAESVAPDSPWIGVMLPYTPLHHLLVHDFGGPLVMTSGNRSDEPIAVGDDEAHERLRGVADAFLGHDRAIHRRCEDSVLRAEFPIRRSRGLVPGSLPLRGARSIVAAGALLKSTFCVATGGRAYVSAHLGDLDSEPAMRAFRSDLELYLGMLGVRPEVVAHDLHPDYLSTAWALEQEAEVVGVQHHHAHAAACLAEHGERGEVLAIVLDGTGYGTDGTLWGGELLRCDLTGFERLAHLEPIPLPGGEAAIREPWRVAAVYLEAAGRVVPWERWRVVREALKVNAPLASGAGRLLDAVAALLGVRERISYEGQAAVELELLAADVEAEPYEFGMSGARLMGAVHDDLHAGRPREEIAAAVHEGLAASFAAAALEAGGGTVALSGGCLQNLRLSAALRRRLEREGVRVLTHRLVPPNDGGISYGQAAVAAARMV